MAEIKFTISDEKMLKVVEALNYLFPIPKDEQGKVVGDWTAQTWAKEVVRRIIIQNVARYEQMKAQQEIKFIPDDNLLS